MAIKTTKKNEKVQKKNEDLEKLQEELFRMKIDLNLKKLKNTRSIFLKRKEIARMLTAQNMQKKSAVSNAMVDKGGNENE